MNIDNIDNIECKTKPNIIEVDAIMENFYDTKEKNTVFCDKTIKRGYTYRKHTVIRASNLNL